MWRNRAKRWKGRTWSCTNWFIMVVFSKYIWGSTQIGCRQYSIIWALWILTVSTKDLHWCLLLPCHATTAVFVDNHYTLTLTTFSTLKLFKINCRVSNYTIQVILPYYLLYLSLFLKYWDIKTIYTKAGAANGHARGGDRSLLVLTKSEWPLTFLCIIVVMSCSELVVSSTFVSLNIKTTKMWLKNNIVVKRKCGTGYRTEYRNSHSVFTSLLLPLSYLFYNIISFAVQCFTMVEPHCISIHPRLSCMD